MTVDEMMRGVMDATIRAAAAVGRFIIESLEKSGPVCGMCHCDCGSYPITVDPTISERPDLDVGEACDSTTPSRSSESVIQA